MKLFILLLAIISQVSATTINCFFITQNFIQIGNRYTCLVNSIDLTESQTILRVTGTHYFGRNNTHVTVLSAVEQSRINFIFKGLSNFFPNLIGIDQTWNNITELNGDEFDEYPKLEYLSLNLNTRLRHIPGTLLSRNDNMRVINFSFCSISTIGENFLNVVARLSYADFIANACFSQLAQNPEQIENLVVNLRNNCAVQEITTSTLTPITSSTTLATSTVDPPGSCNLHETVCELREQNENLLKQNAEINARLDEMSEILLKMNQLLLELTSRPCGR